MLHLLEEPLTIIVLTNLSNTAGRHGTTLGHGIAGLLRPAYTPAALLAPQSDPSPALTQSLERLLRDVAEGHASPVMTAAHAAYYNGLPPVARDPLSERPADLTAQRYITCDDEPKAASASRTRSPEYAITVQRRAGVRALSRSG